MRWKGRARSRNVEDRRRVPGRAVAGGGGLLAVILVVVFTLLNGGDAGQALQRGVQQLQQQQGVQVGAADSVTLDARDQELQEFSEVVLKDTEDVWNALFPQAFNRSYREPILVFYRGATSSGCGHANSAVGPFYCPADNRVYLDLSFFDELQTKFRAPGDFACAYVIAHEVGHHIQNLLGLSMQIQNAQQQASQVDANRLSVRLELQADFLAGVWAHHAERAKQILERGDVGEAIRAAQQIGDDTLQRQATGRVVPDAFTHGTSNQRIRWFTRGLETGDLSDINLPFELAYEEL